MGGRSGMKVSTRARSTIWILWAFTTPLLIWLTYQNTKPDILSYGMDIIGFVILTSIVSFLPIIIKDTPIFLYEGISLAVFLSFGLFAEIFVAQIALTIVLISVRVGWRDNHRIPLNSLIFLFTSIISAIVFYLLGGTHDEKDLAALTFLIPLISYEIIKFFSNQSLIHIAHRILYKKKDHFITKDLLRQALISMLQFPVGVVLYILYVDMGPIATLYIGIPLATFSIIFKHYHASQKVNYYLQKASEIGHQLAGRLNVDEVLDLIIEKLSTVLPVDYAYILDVVEEKDELQLIKYMERGKAQAINIGPLKRNEGIGGTVWQTEKAVLFNKRSEWQDITQGYLPTSVESVICVPIVRNKQVIGVVALASNKRRAYEKYQLMIVDLLVSYLAVAVENAKHYEETKNKSERCPLTELYNYRYFEGVLEKEFSKLTNPDNSQTLSLILLDIDHFKAVNDTYGHQSGNEILCELSNRLVSTIDNRGTVARYGGEEFVILLPNTNKEDSYDIAENVRKMIANNPFTLYNDLDKYRKQILVPITASIGVATAPEDADDPLALVRHADRAMYTGAKQAGRNKVAQYVS